MLKKCDLTEQIDQKTFDKEMDPMRVRLGQLQRELHAGKIPVIIVIEGWNAAGISLTVKELVRAFDPRGIELSTIGPPADEELHRPLLWRFWNRVPPKGGIAIFDRSGAVGPLRRPPNTRPGKNALTKLSSHSTGLSASSPMTKRLSSRSFSTSVNKSSKNALLTVRQTPLPRGW